MRFYDFNERSKIKIQNTNLQTPNKTQNSKISLDFEFNILDLKFI